MPHSTTPETKERPRGGERVIVGSRPGLVVRVKQPTAQKRRRLYVVRFEDGKEETCSLSNIHREMNCRCWRCEHERRNKP